MGQLEIAQGSLESDGQPRWDEQAIDPHLVTLLDPTSFAADQYRALRLMLEQSLGSKMVIAITSPATGDGKTVTAINLAGALAYAAGAQVLIADLDLRAPSVAADFGMRIQSPDLVDALLDPGLPLEVCIRHHPRFPLHVLAPGRTLTMPYELLKSERLAHLLQEARQKYTCVVLDTPPIIPVPDARLLGGMVDGILLVVAAHRTPSKFLAETLNLLDRTKVLGIVFNRDNRPLSGYYSAGGYGYGYGRYAARRRRNR